MKHGYRFARHMIVEGGFSDLIRFAWGARSGGQRSADDSIRSSVDWLLAAYAAGGGGFSGSYSFLHGWDAAYPETTGYIIPTLLNVAAATGYRADEVRTACVKAGEWLLRIQLPDGSFPDSSLTRPFVFDSGQIIFGLLALSRHTGDPRYLTAASRAGDWLVASQSADGAWRTNTFDGAAHSFDVRVAWALLTLHGASAKSAYRDAAVRQADWVCARQRENGWFDHSYRAEESFLHLIAYVVEGMLEVGKALRHTGYLQAASRGVAALATLHREGRLRSYYDTQWRNTDQGLCLTGLSQTALVMKKYGAIAPDADRIVAARAIDAIVLQYQSAAAPARLRGGIPGSHPIGGRYMPFALIEWAVKFHLDSLLHSMEIDDKKTYIIHAG